MSNEEPTHNHVQISAGRGGVRVAVVEPEPERYPIEGEPEQTPIRVAIAKIEAVDPFGVERAALIVGLRSVRTSPPGFCPRRALADGKCCSTHASERDARARFVEAWEALSARAGVSMRFCEANIGAILGPESASRLRYEWGGLMRPLTRLMRNLATMGALHYIRGEARPCDPAVYKDGVSICTVYGTTPQVEAWVRTLAEKAEARLDWHYSGGMANILMLGDDAMRDRVEAWIPRVRFLGIEGIRTKASGPCVMHHTPRGAFGPYREGVTPIPDGVVAVVNA